MAVEKFPIEAGHIMMFARAIGDKNPIYYDENFAKTTEPGGRHCAADLHSVECPVLTRIITCVRKSASPGSVPARILRALSRTRAAAAVQAEACMRNSIMNTSVRPSR